MAGPPLVSHLLRLCVALYSEPCPLLSKRRVPYIASQWHLWLSSPPTKWGVSWHEKEPDLQHLTGEPLSSSFSVTFEGACLDIAVSDVRDFNPHAASNRNTNIINCYRRHEAEKKWAYEERIREVQHSSFTPLVFSEAMFYIYKRLAAFIAEKQNDLYSSTLCWIHCLVSFCLLTSAIQCIWGVHRGSGNKSSRSGDQGH